MQLNIQIRNEQEKDFRAVEELTREAFWNLHYPGCDEHYLAHVLRNHPDFIPGLDFVAEYKNRVIGNIMYSKAWLIDENGQPTEILNFGPVSVLPEFQRKGVGSALIQHTVGIARQTGAKGIVILGAAQNYCKHGFKCAKDFNIASLDSEYPSGMLALELQAGAFSNHQWKFKYSDSFHLSPEEAEKFDQSFPPKKKEQQYTQEIFSIAIRSFVR